MIILQKLTVQDAYRQNLTPSLIVEPEEDFADVIQRFGQMPEVRGIFVADSEQHLLGVITRSDLLDWARAKLGAVLDLSPSRRDKTLRLINLMRASTAGQIMHEDSHRAGVKTGDSLARALHLMIELDLIVLPVVDEANRIVGDLKLAEILSRIVEEEAE